jgi:hypothetical protein
MREALRKPGLYEFQEKNVCMGVMIRSSTPGEITQLYSLLSRPFWMCGKMIESTVDGMNHHTLCILTFIFRLCFYCSLGEAFSRSRLNSWRGTFGSKHTKDASHGLLTSSPQFYSFRHVTLLGCIFSSIASSLIPINRKMRPFDHPRCQNLSVLKADWNEIEKLIDSQVLNARSNSDRNRKGGKCKAACSHVDWCLNRHIKNRECSKGCHAFDCTRMSRAFRSSERQIPSQNSEILSRYSELSAANLNNKRPPEKHTIYFQVSC